MKDHRGRTAQDADYGMGEHSFDSDQLGLIDEEELTQRLLDTFSSESYQPPRLPTVATELLAKSQNPDVEFRDLEKLLERDAMLAGEVLALARSSFYARQRPPDNLRAALVLIGLTRLREVVMEAALKLRVFRCAAYADHMQRLGDHSRATAHLARMVARESPIGEEQAFLGGLLHDVGLAGILLVLGDVPRGQQAPDLDALWSAIHKAHALAGARIALLWKLDPAVSAAISAHHAVAVGKTDHPFAAVVCIAETLATDSGRGFTSPATQSEDEADLCANAVLTSIDRTDPRVVQRAAECLGISEEAMEALRAEAPEWLARHDPQAQPA